MAKKSDWTSEDRERYVELVRKGMTSKQAREAIEQSKEYMDKIKSNNKIKRGPDLIERSKLGRQNRQKRLRFEDPDKAAQYLEELEKNAETEY